MKIEDYDSSYNVADHLDIDQALSKRHDGHNEFWLSHGTERHPTISIVVSGDLASALYFPRNGHPGFVSVGTVSHPEPAQTRVFYVSPTEKIWVRNDQVISFGEALRIAHEFAVSNAMPRCVQWESLVENE